MTQWKTHKAKFEKLSDLLTDPREIAKQHAREDGSLIPIPRDISDWLGRLKLLYGVPFNYLVPDERMLPMESIRFFYVDAVWLDNLVEGAFSIGRSTASELAHDTAYATELHKQAACASKQVRKKLVPGEDTGGTVITPTEKVTGFLLRSAVVKGWPGMIIKAYKDSPGTTPLNVLRMEHLAPNVLLCFYEGIIKELDIMEHPEALHFGVDPPNKIHIVGHPGDSPVGVNSTNQSPITNSKSLKYLVPYQKHEPGEQIDPKVAPPLEMNEYTRKGNKRVLKIDDLAGDIKTELESKIAYTGNFTSAEFALEMIEGVEAVKFSFDD
jgi:hypothetical protein